MGFIGSAAYTSKRFVGFGYRHKKTHQNLGLMGFQTHTDIQLEDWRR
jgi:hypothetical protein